MGIENRNSKKFQKTGSSNPSVTRKNIANNRGVIAILKLVIILVPEPKGQKSLLIKEIINSLKVELRKETIGLITITLPTITITQIKTAKE